MSAQPLPYYTIEEYLELEEKADYKSEYLDGRILAMSGGTPKHSAIGSNIGREMGNLLKRGPCQVYNSDLRVTIMQTGLMTYPDITVVCGEQHFHPRDKDSLINPTVLFEVLPPSTEPYDRVEKWAHYQKLDSLQAYVLVSQTEARVEQYARLEDSSWKFTVVEGLAASLFLPSLGCALPLAEVYDRVTFGKAGRPEGTAESRGGP